MSGRFIFSLLFLLSAHPCLSDNTLPDHYKELGISREASRDEIKQAYRKLIRKHHPDGQGDEVKAKKIIEAYEVLGDVEKREKYNWQWARVYGHLRGNGSRPNHFTAKQGPKPSKPSGNSNSPEAEKAKDRRKTWGGRERRVRFSDFKNSGATTFMNLRPMADDEGMFAGFGEIWGPEREVLRTNDGYDSREYYGRGIPPTVVPPPEGTLHRENTERVTVHVSAPTLVYRNGKHVVENYTWSADLYDYDPRFPKAITERTDKFYVYWPTGSNPEFEKAYWHPDTRSHIFDDRRLIEIDRSALQWAFDLAEEGRAQVLDSNEKWTEIPVAGIQIDLKDPKNPVAYVTTENGQRTQFFSREKTRSFPHPIEKAEINRSTGQLTIREPPGPNRPPTAFERRFHIEKEPDADRVFRQRHFKILKYQGSSIYTFGFHENGEFVSLGMLDRDGSILPLTAEMTKFPGRSFRLDEVTGFFRKRHFVYAIDSWGHYFILGEVVSGDDGEYVKLHPSLTYYKTGRSFFAKKAPSTLVAFNPNTVVGMLDDPAPNPTLAQRLLGKLGYRPDNTQTPKALENQHAQLCLGNHCIQIPADPKGHSQPPLSIPKIAVQGIVFQPMRQAYESRWNHWQDEGDNHKFYISNTVPFQTEHRAYQNPYGLLGGIEIRENLLHQLALFGGWHRNYYGEPTSEFHWDYEVIRHINAYALDDPRIIDLVADYLEALDITDEHVIPIAREEITKLLSRLTKPRDPRLVKAIQSWLIHEFTPRGGIDRHHLILSGSIVDTMEKYLEGVQSDAVIQSLRFHQQILEHYTKKDKPEKVRRNAQQLVDRAERVIGKIGGFQATIYLSDLRSPKLKNCSTEMGALLAK